MKWFYEMQNKAGDVLRYHYELIGYCQFQIVTRDLVIEQWLVKRKKDEKQMQVQVQIRKSGFHINEITFSRWYHKDIDEKLYQS